MTHPLGSILSIAAAAAWLLFSPLPALGQGGPPDVGGRLPEFRLPAPDSAEHRAYLGLEGDAPFTVPEIDARAVIIEIFSMYCPHCQREAPVINRLYHTLSEDPKLKAALKMIGIGVGNTRFEVDHFRKTYDIPFPLFPDGDFSIHKMFGEVRTPYFVVAALSGDGGHEVVYSKLGGIGDPDQFLRLILDRLKLQ